MFNHRGPRRVIRHYANQHTLLRLESSTNEGGTANVEFGDSEPFYSSIRPQDVAKFDVRDTGQVDARRFRMYVLEKAEDMDDSTAYQDPFITHPPIQNGDRVLFDGREWRCVERQPAGRHDFTRFALVLDRRGEDAPGEDEYGDIPYPSA